MNIEDKETSIQEGLQQRLLEKITNYKDSSSNTKPYNTLVKNFPPGNKAPSTGIIGYSVPVKSLGNEVRTLIVLEHEQYGNLLPQFEISDWPKSATVATQVTRFEGEFPHITRTSTCETPTQEDAEIAFSKLAQPTPENEVK